MNLPGPPAGLDSLVDIRHRLGSFSGTSQVALIFGVNVVVPEGPHHLLFASRKQTLTGSPACVRYWRVTAPWSRWVSGLALHPAGRGTRLTENPCFGDPDTLRPLGLSVLWSSADCSPPSTQHLLE